MFVEVITPEKKLFSGESTYINLPGTKGSFGMLNNHAPIVSTLQKGKLKIVEKGGKEVLFDINGGVIESSKNKVIILAE
ncbi:MAG: ATP synthase F1 subunit epsilon [Bacteroidales bacterium]